jgi:hypothetical protein
VETQHIRAPYVLIRTSVLKIILLAAGEPICSNWPPFQSTYSARPAKCAVNSDVAALLYETRNRTVVHASCQRRMSSVATRTNRKKPLFPGVSRKVLPVHRWLGITLGLLFALWFASGIILSFVPFPTLATRDRISHVTLDSGPESRV